MREANVDRSPFSWLCIFPFWYCVHVPQTSQFLFVKNGSDQFTFTIILNALLNSFWLLPLVPNCFAQTCVSMLLNICLSSSFSSLFIQISIVFCSQVIEIFCFLYFVSFYSNAPYILFYCYNRGFRFAYILFHIHFH